MRLRSTETLHSSHDLLLYWTRINNGTAFIVSIARLTSVLDSDKQWHCIHRVHCKTYFCSGLRSTRMMNSLFDGISLSTSALSRRSRWGPSMSWSFLIWSSFEMSANFSKKSCRLLQQEGKEMYVLCLCIYKLYLMTVKTTMINNLISRKLSYASHIMRHTSGHGNTGVNYEMGGTILCKAVKEKNLG